jgi:GST-like protein
MAATPAGPAATEDHSMIELYFWPTSNGKKIIILLEECGMPYTIRLVDIHRGDQFHHDYLRINPNNRIPAIFDTTPMGGGAPISIFESGAIMMYLAEKAGQFWPQAVHHRYEVVQWVMWQLANQGPKSGEQSHFRRAAGDPKNGDLSYATRRFDNEIHRLFGVLNLGLFRKRYLAAGAYTIADMICYPWASQWRDRGIDIEEFPHTKHWLEELGARPAIQKAMALKPEVAEAPAAGGAEETMRRATLVEMQRARPIPEQWRGAAITQSDQALDRVARPFNPS